MQTQSKLSRLSLGGTLWSPTTALFQRIPPKLQLRCLDVSELQITDDAFKGIVKICPSLTDVDISSCANLTESSIQACEENLSGLFHFKANFSEGHTVIIGRVPRLLEKHGINLRTLHLAFLEPFDVSTIILHCQSLETLVLQNCLARVSSVSMQSLKAKWGDKIRPELLKKGRNLSLCETNPTLRHLDISYVEPQGEDPGKQLGILLNHSSHIKMLNLSFLSSLTDAVLMSFIATSEVSSLEQLNVIGCHNISAAPLKSLLDLCPNLHTLDVSRCECVTRRDYHSLVAHSKGNGQTTKINWC